MKPTAIIIGPGSAFGVELCAALLKTRDVITISRSSQNTHPGVKNYSCDLCSKEFDEKIIEVLGTHSIDLVIYSAKYSPHGGLNLAPDELMKAFNVNVIGLLKTIHALAQTKNSSHVVVIGGGYKDVPHPNKVALSTSKAAVHNMVLAMQEECLRNHIVLSELIIDGRIGVDGDIQSTDVVQKILDVSISTDPVVNHIP